MLHNNVARCNRGIAEVMVGRIATTDISIDLLWFAKEARSQ